MFSQVKSMDHALWQFWQHNQPFNYRLHSRFSHAINWINDEGEMITFLSRDLPNGPNTMIINIESFNDWALSECASLKIQDPHMLLSGQTIDLNDVPKWQVDLPVINDLNPIIIQKIQQFLDENNEALLDLEQMIYQRLDDNFSAMIHAIEQKNNEDIIQHASASIGLGLGLTPSGDDRLVGFLLGCYLQSPENLCAIHALQIAIDNNRDRTNEISYSMLKHAKNGRFNEWLVNLGDDIAETDIDLLDQAMMQVFSIGSRSGGDMLKGLQLSLEQF
mgnify:CR=1 FL=1